MASGWFPSSLGGNSTKKRCKENFQEPLQSIYWWTFFNALQKEVTQLMEPNQRWDIFLVRLLHYQVPTLLRLVIKYRKKGTLRPAKKRRSSLMWNLTWSVSRAWMNLSGSIPIGNCHHSNRWVLWTTHAITSFYPYKRLTRYTNNLF
jgi:hypothetical protein